MAEQTISKIEDQTNMKDQKQIETLIEICQDIIPMPLQEEDWDDIEKELKDEFEKEYTKGSFQCKFGNFNSGSGEPPKGSSILHLQCNGADDERIDLFIQHNL